MTGYSYYTSALIAEKLGAFESYEINSEYMKRVIRNHARVGGALADEFENLDYEPLMVNHDLLPDNISMALKKWLGLSNN